MAEASDNWLRVHRRPPTRAEAMRQLAEAGIRTFSPEMIAALTRWAETQPDQPDWPEAARRLLVDALRADREG